MIELARLGHVTQPRMSQIMALNQLAPDIQEALLNLPATKGKPEIHEKRLRPIAAMLTWKEQRGAWKQICDEVGFQNAVVEESVERTVVANARHPIFQLVKSRKPSSSRFVLSERMSRFKTRLLLK